MNDNNENINKYDFNKESIVSDKKKSSNFTFVQLMLAGVVIYIVSQLAYTYIFNSSIMLTRVINIICICLMEYIFLNIMKKADTYNASLIKDAKKELFISMLFVSCIGMADRIVYGNNIMVSKIKFMAVIMFITVVISLIRRVSINNVALIAGQVLLELFVLCCLEEVIGFGEFILAVAISQVVFIKEALKFISRMREEDSKAYAGNTSQHGMYGDEQYRKIVSMMEQSKKYAEEYQNGDDDTE